VCLDTLPTGTERGAHQQRISNLLRSPRTELELRFPLTGNPSFRPTIRMALNLDSLPTEIIESVCRALDRKDLFHLRSVSRALNAKTFNYFGSKYFRLQSIDLSPDSIERLQQISEHDRIKHYVQGLSIGYDRSGTVPGMDDVPALGPGNSWNRLPSGCLDSSSPAVSLLREILARNLLNCRSFHVCHQWGTLEGAGSQAVTGTDAVGLLLNTIGDLNLNVEHFSFALSISPEGKPNLDGLQSPIQQASFRQAWAHLQELEFWTSLPGTAVPWASDLIVLAKNLRRLTIVCNVCDDLSTINSLLDRLSHTKLPRLQEFTIQHTQLDAETLCRFLYNFQYSLRVLNISCVTIENGTWASVLKNLGAQLDALWKISIDQLIEQPLLLPAASHRERLQCFLSLKNDSIIPGTGGRSFTLVEGNDWAGQCSRKCKVYGINYQGPRMDVALETLASSIYFHIRPPLPPSPAPREVHGLETIRQKYLAIHKYVNSARWIEAIKPGEIITIIHRESNGLYIMHVTIRY